MPKTVEMVHRFVSRLGVIDVDARSPQRGAELATVHDRRAFRAHRANQRGRLPRQPMAEENQTVGLLALQHHRVAFFAFLVVLRISDEHRIAFALGSGLDALQNQRKERVGDIRNRHDDFSGLQRAQVFGCRVGLVAQLLDRLENPAPRGRSHDARLAEHTGHGGRRHPSASGYFIDRGHSKNWCEPPYAAAIHLTVAR